MTAPRLSRRHAAGSASARGLLFTVLGEFVLPSAGAAWTSAVIDVFARLGVEEKATRQALMRTAADGWLTSERSGRRTLWRLTPAAEKLLVEGTARIYGFTGIADEWDGRWLIALARAPETERGSRHLLRTRMAWTGLGSPSPGLWVSTHAARLEQAEAVLAEAGVRDGQVFVAEHFAGDLPAMVRQAWDLDALQAAYAEFADRFDGAPADDPLAGTVELVHAWRRFPWIDPLLPAELLPAPWPGVAAAALFAARHGALAPSAAAAWAELNA